MSIYVFQLERDGDFHTLASNQETGLDIGNKLVAEYASEITKKKVNPGDINWYVSDAPTSSEALLEAIDNGYSYCDPARVRAIEQSISRFLLVVSHQSRPGVQN